MISLVTLICPVCNSQHEKPLGHYNRAMKLGAPVYCGKNCAGIARRKHKTHEQIKAEKSEYDRRRLNGEKRGIILTQKREYHYANRDIINAKQRIRNRKRMPEHILYCRQPEQREKERQRNHKRNGLTKIKKCLCCNKEKQLIHFESYPVFPDKRLYLCKDCEEYESKELGISTRDVLQCIRSGLVKHRSVLTIKDVTPYPYLIESYKYLLLLKRLTK